MARGFTGPVLSSCTVSFFAVFTALIKSEATLGAKQTLVHILRTESVKESVILIEYLVGLLDKGKTQKRKKRSFACVVLGIDPASWTVTVPESSGRTPKIAIEDVQRALRDDKLANLV